MGIAREIDRCRCAGAAAAGGRTGVSSSASRNSFIEAKRSLAFFCNARRTTEFIIGETRGFSDAGGGGASLTWQTMRRPSVSPVNGGRPVSAS